MQVRVFDPEMCCTTGICGSAPDPALIEFNSTLQRLKAEGADVERYQLSRNPRSFVGHADVYRLLLQKGAAALPVTVVDGAIVAVGSYPDYEQMRARRQAMAAVPAAWTGPAGGCG